MKCIYNRNIVCMYILNVLFMRIVAIFHHAAHVHDSFYLRLHVGFLAHNAPSVDIDGMQ